MPTGNEIDIELPSIFIKRALTNPDPRWVQQGYLNADSFQQMVESAQALVAEHGNRFWRDLNVKAGAQVPYIYWSGGTNPGKSIRYNVPRTIISKKQSTFTVRTVRRFPMGSGTYNLSRPAYNNMMKCLTGLTYTPVWNDQNVLLGHISQSIWADDHQVSVNDEEAQETEVELGIVVEIIYN